MKCCYHQNINAVFEFIHPNLLQCLSFQVSRVTRKKALVDFFYYFTNNLN